MSDELARVAIFNQKEIRKSLHNGEWWFVVVDVISALTESVDPVQYLKKLRKRDAELAKFFDPHLDKGGGTDCTPPLSKF